jgi:hypothetical protein
MNFTESLSGLPGGCPRWREPVARAIWKSHVVNIEQAFPATIIHCIAVFPMPRLCRKSACIALS